MKAIGNRGSNRVEILKLTLSDPESRKQEIDALNELAWEYRIYQMERAYELSKKAGVMSQAGEFLNQHYIEGLSESLVTQAFLDTYAGNLDAAVSKCLQSLALLHEMHTHIEIKVWFTLAWNSYFLGNYPTALEDGLKALKLAREFGDRLHEAWVLDALASFHGITGDFEAAIPLHEQALAIFKDLDESIGELRTLNNLAVTLNELKRYENALQAGYKSLKLAEKFGLVMDVQNNSCTIADTLINMRKLETADEILRDAIARSVGNESFITQVYLLERQGRIRLLKKDLSSAEAFLFKALNLAKKLEQRAEEALCHKALSEIYEAMAQDAKALLHYKIFHGLSDEIQGKKAREHLAVLKITHQVESAQRDADIYRLEALELQRKMDEQRQIQSVLEHQNTIDSLTELHNRRYFDDRFPKEYSRHSRSGAELSLLILDVDHFKNFNDTYGHVRGDACLQMVAAVIRSSISRPPDIAVRYGGEEFVCLLPETSQKGAVQVAENIRQGVMDLNIPHEKSSAAQVVTISVGVLTTHCYKDGAAMDLLIRADEELYKAKSKGRNRVEVSTQSFNE